MSTRSMIGMTQEDGSILAIYCHWDGYVEHNGEILVDYYNTPQAVKKLLKLGNLSVLGKTIGLKKDFESARGDEECLAYGRDRGEKGQKASVYKNKKDYVSDPGCIEYFYLFQDGKWMYKHVGSSRFMNLVKAVEAIA